MYISTLTHRKCFRLEAQESQVRVTPLQCLIKERLRANPLHKDSCTAHWWALTLFSSINVKWIFVTSIINYQYWHCDCIWLHLGWKFKNRLKNQNIQLLSCLFTRWNPAFEKSGLNWSQCLADFFKWIVSLWLWSQKIEVFFSSAEKHWSGKKQPPSPVSYPTHNSRQWQLRTARFFTRLERQ